MDFKAKIEEIRAYAITARTAIYNEDAMTAIELAGVTACKVNQCVNAINGLLEVVEGLESDHRELGLEYNADSEELKVNT